MMHPLTPPPPFTRTTPASMDDAFLFWGSVLIGLLIAFLIVSLFWKGKP